MNWLKCVLLFCAAINLALSQTGGENDPRVQTLYAEARAAQSAGDIAGAIEKYEEILKIAPKLGAAYNNLGALYLRQRAFPKAADVLERGLKINPAMSSTAALLGIALFETASYEEARTRLETALRANPKDDNVELFLVKDLNKLGDMEAAEVHLRQLTARQPGNQELWYLLATLHMKLSEQALAKMNAIDPNSVWAHELSGEVMESMNNYEGAVVEFKKAVDVAPRQPGVHYKLGDAYWSQSQWDLATAQFEAELKLDPENCLADGKLGDILVRKNGDSERAMSHLNAALAGCPNLADALADRARILVRLNRNEDAARDLEKAVKLNPADPGAHYLYAKVLRALGKTAESQAEMETFSRLDADARAGVAKQAEEVIKNKESAR